VAVNLQVLNKMKRNKVSLKKDNKKIKIKIKKKSVEFKNMKDCPNFRENIKLNNRKDKKGNKRCLKVQKRN